jgi:thiamine pyrophosphokinase
MGSHERAVALVLAGGDPPHPRDLDDLPDASDALVIAADSGLHHAQRLRYPVDVVVGDLDSVDPAALARAEQEGAAVERHPAEKDATDLALALRAAKARGVERVVALGLGGGRFDHLLANALVLVSDELAPVRIEARVDGARLHVIREGFELAGAPGDLVSLFAVAAPARGVATDGLRYPLRGETLHPGSTRGVSNELVAAVAHVSVADGVLLAVRPDPATTRRTPPAPSDVTRLREDHQ